MRLKTALAFIFSFSLVLGLNSANLRAQMSFDFSFVGINGICSSLTFSAANFDANVNFVAVVDADNNVLLGISTANFNVSVNNCTRNFRFFTFYNDGTPFLVEEFSAPTFLLVGAPSQINQTIFNATEVVNIGATRCINPSDWDVTVQPLGGGFNPGLLITQSPSVSPAGPNLELSITPFNLSVPQSYRVTVSANSAFCNDFASDFFIVDFTPSFFPPGGFLEDEDAPDAGSSVKELVGLIEASDIENATELKELVLSAQAIEGNREMSLEETVNQITVFPNPANDQINLRYNQPITEIQLVNQNGQIVRVLSGAQIGKTQVNLAVADLPAGQYAVFAITDTGDTMVQNVQIK